MIARFTPSQASWPAYVAHLERHNMARWALDDGQPAPDVYLLGAMEADRVIGHISVRVQDLVIPPTEWSAGHDHGLRRSAGEPLRETFVNTFAVDETHRRQGYGRALQIAALDLTRELGCYQMRSWSSLDKTANYALKISLGFAVFPAVYTTGSGQLISGAYFVKTV
jgi:GNAT superfamily N-acetyltransferase